MCTGSIRGGGSQENEEGFPHYIPRSGVYTTANQNLFSVKDKKASASTDKYSVLQSLSNGGDCLK